MAISLFLTTYLNIALSRRARFNTVASRVYAQSTFKSIFDRDPVCKR